MSLDSRSFRDALGRFASGVTVVTVRDADGVHGITVSAFSSVSLEPPLVMVAVGKKARAHARIAAAGRFGVSVLAADQQVYSDLFAGRPGVEAVPVWRESGWATPVLEGALAQLDCSVAQAVDAGDHTIFLGSVEQVAVHDGEPLAYWKGAYRGVVAR